METKAIIGATAAAAVGYFGAKLVANLDDVSSLTAGLGLAAVVGGALQMTSTNAVPVSDMQAAWEAELAEGGNGDNLKRVPVPEQEEKHEGGCCGPPPPRASPLPAGAESMGHPLGGEELKITKEGIIDFDQHCKLMVFCTKMAGLQMNAATKELRQKRREAGKENNEQAYQQIVLQKHAMASQMDGKMLETVFMRMQVPQEVFEKTMQTYFQNPQKGPILQNLIRQVKGVPQLLPEDAAKVQILRKDQLLSLIKIQIEGQIQSLDKMLSGKKQPETEQEKQIQILTQQAKDEDAFFEKTGMEYDILNYSIIKQDMNKDPDFIALSQGAQQRIQQIQMQNKYK